MELVDIKAKDFCCYENLSLPLSEQGLVWVGGENEDTKSANNNGSGKSTLFKALTWCLYGQTIDGEKGDKVIRQGAKEAEVEILLYDGKAHWIVKRSRKKGAPNVDLIQPDGERFQASKEEIQTKIIEMVGLDFHAFKNTVLYGQNDSARFAHPKTKDSERKEMLHRILRTEILKHCYEIAKEERLELSKNIQDYGSKVDVLLVRIEEQKVDQLETLVEQAEERRKREVEGYKNDALKYKKVAQDFLRRLKDVEPKISFNVEEVKEEIEDLKEEKESLQGIDQELKDINYKLEKMKDVEMKLVGDVARSSHTCTGLREDLLQLDADKCPTCTAPLSEGEGAKYIEGLKQAEKEAITQDTQNRKELSDHRKKTSKVEKQKKELLKKEKKEKRITRTLFELQSQIQEAEQAETKAEAKRKVLESDARKHMEAARESLRKVEEREKEPNPYQKQFKEAKNKVKSFKKEIKSLKKELKKLNEELGHVEFWVKGFSNQGLPSYVLDSVMPFITERANHYLETLADGDIVLEFTTQQEKKSQKGQFKDQINISWKIEGVDDSYPPSGGQLKKIEIATDFALMDLVSARESGHINILALDEVLDGLDEEGRQRVLMLLHELRSRRSSIFVISHESNVSEVFEHAVIAKKKNGIATLEVAA